MDRFARLLDAPKGVVTLALLAALACIWLIDCGFAGSVHLADTGEELYLPAASPLSLVFADLAGEAPGGFALVPGRPVHLRTVERFVSAAALQAAEQPTSEDFLVRLYMFASELVSECERRRVDPAGLHRALDAMASALRVELKSQAGQEADTEPAPAPQVAAEGEAVPAPAPAAQVADLSPAPEPAPVVTAVPVVKETPAAKTGSKKKAAAPKSTAKAAAPVAPAKPAVAPVETAEATDAAAEAEEFLRTIDRSPMMARAPYDESLPPDRILRTGDRIVESLELDLGFLVR